MRRRFFFSLLAWLIWDRAHLECNTYIISCENLPAAFEGYRIAQISDLHNGKIGKDNQELLSSLTELKPDMIAVTGDLVDSRNTDLEVALRFMEQAMLIAPGQGLFPAYDAGLYSADTTNMIISRGLGNSLLPFRINCRPEVILVELTSQ